MDILYILNAKKYSADKWNGYFKNNSFNDLCLKQYSRVFEHAKTMILASGCEAVKFAENHCDNYIIRELGKIILNLVSRVYLLEYEELNYQISAQVEYKKPFYSCYEELLYTTVSGKLFFKYPVLKSQLDIQVTQFIKCTCILIERLSNNISEVQGNIINALGNCNIIDINKLGDLHYKGQFVACISLIDSKEHKYKIIYKPRSLAIDQAFYDFLIWITNLTGYSFKAPKYLSHKQYGWVEYINYMPCKSKEQVNKYYFRLGMLLAATYLLYGSDIHAGNIIASGEYPVIIDLECITSPLTLENANKSSLDKNLVIFSAMIPKIRMCFNGSKGFDVSAFAGQSNIEHPYYDWTIYEPKNGYPEIKRIKKIVEKKFNIPILKKQTINPYHYEGEFIRGFAFLYSLFIKNKKKLLSNCSPLMAYSGKEVRIVFRNTSIYSKLLYESTHPFLLKNKVKWGEHFKYLYKLNRNIDFIDSEIRSLRESSIPRFYCFSDDNIIYDLYKNNTGLKTALNSIDRVKYNIINNLTKIDMKKQCILLSQCLGAAKLSYKLLNKRPIKPSFHNKNTNDTAYLANIALQNLSSNAIIEEGKIFWYTAEMTESGSCIITSLDLSFYKGLAGILYVYWQAKNMFNDEAINDQINIAINYLSYAPDIITKQIKNSGFLGISGVISILNLFNPNNTVSSINKSINAYLGFVNSKFEKEQNISIVSGLSGDLILLIFSLKHNNNYCIRSTLKLLADNIFLKLDYAVKKQYIDIIINKNFWNENISAALALIKYAKFTNDKNLFDNICTISIDLLDRLTLINIDNLKYSDYLGILNLLVEIYPNRFIASINLNNFLFKLYRKLDKNNLSLFYGYSGYIDLLIKLERKNFINKSLLDKELKNYTQTAGKSILHLISNQDATLILPDLMRGHAGLIYQLIRITDPINIPSLLPA